MSCAAKLDQVTIYYNSAKWIALGDGDASKCTVTNTEKDSDDRPAGTGLFKQINTENIVRIIGAHFPHGVPDNTAVLNGWLSDSSSDSSADSPSLTILTGDFNASIADVRGYGTPNLGLFYSNDNADAVTCCIDSSGKLPSPDSPVGYPYDHIFATTKVFDFTVELVNSAGYSDHAAVSAKVCVPSSWDSTSGTSTSGTSTSGTSTSTDDSIFFISDSNNDETGKWGTGACGDVAGGSISTSGYSDITVFGGVGYCTYGSTVRSTRPDNIENSGQGTIADDDINWSVDMLGDHAIKSIDFDMNTSCPGEVSSCPDTKWASIWLDPLSNYGTEGIERSGEIDMFEIGPWGVGPSTNFANCVGEGVTCQQSVWTSSSDPTVNEAHVTLMNNEGKVAVYNCTAAEAAAEADGQCPDAEAVSAMPVESSADPSDPPTIGYIDLTAGCSSSDADCTYANANAKKGNASYALLVDVWGAGGECVGKCAGDYTISMNNLKVDGPVGGKMGTDK